jgi:hypothetical protein
MHLQLLPLFLIGILNNCNFSNSYLGSLVGNANLLKLNYDYGTMDNNGNVKSQTITVQRSNQSPLVLTQSYVY